MKINPTIIKFNGSGQPINPDVKSGSCALLLQDGEIELVKILLLPPDEFGPELIHADNVGELRKDIIQYLETLDISKLTGDKHWLLKCPDTIAH